MLLTDRSWTVPLHVTIAREQIGLDVEAATGDTSADDVVLGPNGCSSTENVTGGRKLARYDFWASRDQSLLGRNSTRSINVASSFLTSAQRSGLTVFSAKS
jgi:hypothetical protein